MIRYKNKQAMTPKILRIDNITKSYGKKMVLRGISMEIKQGEVVGLMGPNGSGKTTSFYIIVGLIGADSGNIFLNQIEITRLPIYQRAKLGIGYLPQESSIFRGMTVEQNIMCTLEISESKPEKRREKLEDLLNEFSITHIRKSHAMSLSGGERRRVEIARSIACDPTFILLDEPFAGVDPIAVKEIRGMVAHLKDRGIGVLITDHNVRETFSIVDRGYIVYDGEILASGDKAHLMEHEEVRRVYLGDEFKI